MPVMNEKTMDQLEMERHAKNAQPRTVKVQAINSMKLSGVLSAREAWIAPGVVLLLSEYEAERMIEKGHARRVKDSTKEHTIKEREQMWNEHRAAIRKADIERRQMEKRMREGEKV